MPLALNLSFFHDYLKTEFSENFNYMEGNYYHSSRAPQYFYQLYSSIKIYTSLAKKTSFLHIINPSVTLNLTQSSKLSEENNLLTYTRINNSLTFSLFQIFEKGNFYMDHDLKQIIDVDFKNPRPFQNILNVTYGKISFNENNKYDWHDKKILYNSATFSFPVRDYNVTLSHIYQNSDDSKIESYTFRVERNLNKYKKIYFEYNYDMINKYIKYLLLGVELNKKCWQYNISVQKSRVPVLKTNGISYMNNYILNFEVNFYPIGGLKQSIQIN
jgi:LPS-assembly protein